MDNFVAVLHIAVALVLILLVLVQDSKSGSLGGAFGGGGSNSILGATGGASLAEKATRIAAIVFAVTCISLTMMSSRTSKSVIDGMISEPAAAPAASNAAATAGVTTTVAPAATSSTSTTNK